MDLLKGMKSTKNTKYAANHIKCFIFIHISIKERLLLKIIKIKCGVYNFSRNKTYDNKSIKPGR